MPEILKPGKIPLGSEDYLAEPVELIRPEDIPEIRISQESVLRYASEFQLILSKHETLKTQLDQVGVDFSGRVMLIGQPGSDFESFIYHLVRDVPLNLVRIRRDFWLGNDEAVSAKITAAVEFAKRSSPSILFLNDLELIAAEGEARAAAILFELQNIGWNNDEVIVVASTTRPDRIDQNVLAAMNYTFIIGGSTRDDRTRIYEQVLKDRNDIDPSLLAELTDGWSFTDARNLAVNILFREAEGSGQVSRDELEHLIEKARVLPVGDISLQRSMLREVSGERTTSIERITEEYPEEFIDQLYLMAVGEDYQGTQRVIETINSNLPLSEKDREFLSRHPYILTGSSEDRLSRLLRAKKTTDRLRRVLGREL